MNNNANRQTTFPRSPAFGLPAALTACLVAVLALAAPPARAAQTGELQGFVVDESGLPVAGVRVIITSPQMIGGERVGTTDADGKFRFNELEPGSYTVTLSSAKYRGFEESNIAVGVGSTVIRDYLLEPAESFEGTETDVIRVTATAPVVDVTRVSQGISIRPDFTDRAATSRDYQGVALFTPGVVAGSQASGNPSIHGGTSFSNLYLLDGLNISDPVTQTFSNNFNFDSIGELQILTGGLDAEFGYTTGGVINIITKSGGDEFTLDGSVYWAPKELQLLDPGEVNDSNEIQANLAIGGPIIKKKLWFFVSGQYVDNQSTTPLEEESIFPGVDAIPTRRFNAFYGLGKLKWQPLPWQKLTLLVQGDPTNISNERQSAFVHPDAERQRFQGGVTMVGTSETTISEDLFWKTQLGYTSGRLYLFPQSCSTDTACFDKSGRTNLETGTSTVNDTQIVDDRRYRLNLNTSLSYFLSGFLGDHEFKVGAEGALTFNPTLESRTGGQVFRDNGIAQTGSTIDGAGDPFQVDIFPTELNKNSSSNLISFYIQDTWKPFRSLTIRPGLRFDSSRGYNDPEDGGEEIFNFNALSPRIGAAWDPFGDNKTVIRGGYFMYRETGLLSVPGFVGRGLASETYQYNPATEQYDIFVRREGGEGAVEFKDNMTNPTMHEVIFGVQREVFDETSVAVDFTWRYRTNMFEDDESNVIWNERGDNGVGFRNGDPRFIFNVGTPDEAIGQYVGVDLIFEKRLSDNWSALANYTLSRLEGNVESLITYTLDNPTQREYEYGFLADDVRHKGRLTLTYDLPFGFQVGATGIYQSGRPESKFFLNQFYGDFLDLRATRGYDPKNVDDPDDDVELRLPDFFIVNARVAWRLDELTGQDIWLIADVFNLFNSRPTTAIENRDQPAGAPTQFGDPISRGGPLNAQVAVRYQF